MADKEISELTAATTPLTGTELVHIDQGGDSRKVALTDIAAIATGAMLKATYDPNDDGVIAVAQGGTNAATASGARTNLGLGTMAVQNAGTVAITGGSVTGITDLTVADGGTGASDASGARTNLGLAIGTDVQAYSANLAGFAATTVANVQNRDNHTGTQLAATISDFSTAADLRVSAAIGSTVQAYSALLDSVSALSLTAGDIIYATGEDAVASLPAGASGQVLAIDDDGNPAWDTSLVVGGLLADNNLSDVASAGTALTNLGVSAFAQTILDDTTADAALTTLGAGATGKLMLATATKAAASQIVVGDTHIDLVARYGVVGGNDAGDNAKIQAALDDTTIPIGSILHFPENTAIKITTTLEMTRFLHLRGGIIRGDFPNTDTTSSLISVKITSAGAGSTAMRGMSIEPTNYFMNNGASFCGKHAIYLESNGTTLPHHLGFRVSGGIVAGAVTTPAEAICLHGTTGTSGSQFGIFENMTMYNGIFFSDVSDGHRVVNNVIYGVLPAKIDLVEGAYCTLFMGNAMVSQNGAFDIVNGSQINIWGNQIEQNGVNGQTPSTSILVRGIDRVCKGISIMGNNFGGGTNVDTGITLYNARECVIDQNQFNVHAVQDINFGDSGGVASYNTLGSNNRPRGTRSLQTGRTDTTRRLIIAEDADCVGNRGFWKPMPTGQNGWTLSDDRYMVDPSGKLVFQAGSWVGGTLTVNTLIATMPLGARPQANVFLTTMTGAGTGVILFSTDGTIKVGQGTMPNATVYSSSISPIQVEWMDSHYTGA